MEKLEEILQVEDTARTAVADAQVEAVKTVSDARASAAELLRTSREETRAVATARHEAVLEEARDAAASLKAAGEQELARVLAAAATRRDDAVGAVLEDLKGR